jgi:hypothetical protein
LRKCHLQRNVVSRFHCTALFNSPISSAFTSIVDGSLAATAAEVKFYGSRGRRTAAKIESACSPWPSWVYRMYDDGDLARRVRESVPGTSYVAQNRNKFLQTSGHMPCDPVELSHWVARSLPFPESDRITLLQFNSAAQRLRYELSLTAIDKFRTLGCAVCGREIAKQVCFVILYVPWTTDMKTKKVGN